MGVGAGLVGDPEDGCSRGWADAFGEFEGDVELDASGVGVDGADGFDAVGVTGWVVGEDFDT